MSESGHAVFLSYASQDVEAAGTIFAALRSAGVEVWFDQSELRGGDAWDAKIRRRIRDCALFVPVISAHTQERLEGYYRLEWKLAVDRSHLMAEEKVFFVPVVIDDTTDAEAKVPDKFRDVQWTRLRGGVTAAGFAERVKLLLANGAPGEAGRSGTADSRLRVGSSRGSSETKRSFPLAWLFLLIPVAAVLLASGGFFPKRAKDSDPGGAGMTATQAQEPTEAWRTADRARRHFQGIFTRADLAQAEELGRRASEAEPTLALAWAVRAGANASYLMRGFVAGEAAQLRARDAQEFADRALAINKEETEALLARGHVALYQKAPAQAEAFFRRVMKNDPDNSFARRYLSIVLRETDRVAEAIGLMQESVKRFPRDTLSHFDLALAYAWGWNWPRAWEAADAALAIEPFPGALMLKVRLAFQWKGDVVLMRELLNQVDLTYRSEDDAVVWDLRCGLFERQPDHVFEAAGRTTRNYFEESFTFPAPKAWFTARAYQLAGKPGLAHQQWLVAETVMRERVNADPHNLDLRLKLAVTLAWAKESDKAQQELRAIESAWREQLNPDHAWDLASFYAASGSAAKAVPLLRQALHAGTGIAPLTVTQLKLDPWYDLIRDAPEFEALLQNPPPVPPPVGNE